jgi:hypothetical protein
MQQFLPGQRPSKRTGAKNLRHKGSVLSIVIAVAVAAAVAGLLVRLYRWRPRLTTIQGAVIRRAEDPPKQQPIAGVLVTASRGVVSASTQSDASGYFRIRFPEVIWPGQTVRLSFRQPDYHPLDMNLTMEFRSTARRLIVAALAPRAAEVKTVSTGPAQTISNIRIRYTVNTENEENFGGAVKTFTVENQGNIPCRRQGPCSPDGEWKAATASVTLDAGPENQFRNVRASCIAGPCPFTRIQTHSAADGGRMIVATATDWSDTATFLLEAEIFHTSIGSNVRESYPVIFDRTLSFTLPTDQEGVSIQAEINGAPMVFPLGGSVYLSWANCTVRTSGSQKSTVYQCELKPGFKFP